MITRSGSVITDAMPRIQPEKAMSESKPPFPPFRIETAIEKVRLAEDAWNSRDPSKVSMAYTVDSHWRNRAEFIVGREQIVAFITRKWAKELDYLSAY